MIFRFFLRGIIIGFSIAAPVGPIGVLCIRRTLADGRIIGLISGLGAATADAIYGSIAAFGITLISNILIEEKVWIASIGGIFLCYLGIKTLLSKPVENSISAVGTNLIEAYASTFFLTLTNPMTIMSFAAIFVGLGLASTPSNYLFGAVLVLGVFLGASLWWLILSSTVETFRTKFSLEGLQWVNRVSGTVITAFGILALSSIFYSS